MIRVNQVIRFVRLFEQSDNKHNNENNHQQQQTTTTSNDPGITTNDEKRNYESGFDKNMKLNLKKKNKKQKKP